MQVATIEFAKTLWNQGANSTEFDKNARGAGHLAAGRARASETKAEHRLGTWRRKSCTAHSQEDLWTRRSDGRTATVTNSTCDIATA